MGFIVFWAFFNLFTNRIHGRHNTVPATKAFPGVSMIVTSDRDFPEKIFIPPSSSPSPPSPSSPPSSLLNRTVRKVAVALKNHLQDKTRPRNINNFSNDVGVDNWSLIKNDKNNSPWNHGVNDRSSIANHEDPTGPGCLAIMFPTR